MKIVLFLLPDDQKSLQAHKLLIESMGEHEFQVQECPSGMAQQYPIPFLTLEDNSPIYGLKGIEYYLSHREEFRPLIAA